MIIVNRILWILNILAGLMLLIAYLSPFIDPMVWWIAAFFGLAFPVLFAVNVLFLLYWIISGKLKLFFPALCLLAGFNHYSRIYKLSGTTGDRTDQDVLIFSMNVKSFGKISDDLFIDTLTAYLKAENPDLFCIQEYRNDLKPGERTAARLIRANTGLRYLITGKETPTGTVIFSRYKPLASGSISFGENTDNGAVWADFVLPGKDTVRVYCCHFQSNGLSRSEQIVPSDMQDKDKAVRKSKSLIKRLKTGFEKRSEQVELVRSHMDESPYPVIIAGDFNDTQLSYTYRTIRGNGLDAFVESGKGLGNTYVGPFPSYRIDYIFHDADFESINYLNGPSFQSDHRLIRTLIRH